jgi:hypothetical protein
VRIAQEKGWLGQDTTIRDSEEPSYAPLDDLSEDDRYTIDRLSRRSISVLDFHRTRKGQRQ